VDRTLLSDAFDFAFDFNLALLLTLPLLLICMKGQQAESTTVEERRFSAAKSAPKEPGFSPCGFDRKYSSPRPLRNSLQLSSQSPSGPELGKPLHPPPPRYIGIIDLGGKWKLIYGAQQLTGKILPAKDLSPHPCAGKYRLRLDDDELASNRAQGQMSQGWAVEISEEASEPWAKHRTPALSLAEGPMELACDVDVATECRGPSARKERGLQDDKRCVWNAGPNPGHGRGRPKSPQRLKPDRFSDTCGAAEATPFQTNSN
jgi:hypothetical protein